MSAFPNSPPHKTDVHHRSIAAGRGRTRTTPIFGDHLTASITTFSAKRLTTNTPTSFRHRAAGAFEARNSPVAQRVLLKSP